MPAPRQVVPGSFYEISRRCVQGQFLMRPDEETNNAYLYCLILAAYKFQIGVMMMCAMSNHHHLVIYDEWGRYPEFIEYLHKLFARSQNALRVRKENFWASTQTSVVKLLSDRDVFRKMAYAAANPVAAHLVANVKDWPGVNGYEALKNDTVLEATRPSHFFRTSMPAKVSMKLIIPERMGDREVVVAAVVRRVEAIEAAALLHRKEYGGYVVGAAAVMRQSWKAVPAGGSPDSDLNPRFAGCREMRMAAIADFKLFVENYQKARALWKLGSAAPFPYGTYWLRRFASVPVMQPGPTVTALVEMMN